MTVGESGKIPHFLPNEELDDAFQQRTFFNDFHLPGQTWESGNMFTHTMFVPNCNMDDGVYRDPVWYDSGNSLHVNRNPVLNKLFYSDPVRRLQAVEQLTLPPKYSTVPNTGAFSRFEHIWGSVLFVEQMAQRHDISEREKTILQLRTLLSDVGHTTGSHLGDWLFQGVGNGENQHDLELKQYLAVTGIAGILQHEGIDLDEVVFPDVSDWVEAPQPDLCVDRVDYGLREMNRWNQTILLEHYSADDFTITPDGMLAMKSLQRARLFSEGFLLLSQENWAEPTHRAVLDLFMLRTKLFYAQGHAPRTWVFKDDFDEGGALVPLHEIHPRDLMYVTDFGQLQAFAYPDLVGNYLEAIMTSIAQYHRQYIWPRKNNRIDEYLWQFTSGEYKNVLNTGTYTPYESTEFSTFRDRYPSTLPGFAILPEDVAPSEESIDITQEPFKIRQIDPLIQNGDDFRRLSELDPSYKTRLDEHRRQVSARRVARFAIPDPDTRKMFKDTMLNIDAAWQERLEEGRRMTPAEMRELVRVASREVIGHYPFMTHFDI